MRVQRSTNRVCPYVHGPAIVHVALIGVSPTCLEACRRLPAERPKADEHGIPTAPYASLAIYTAADCFGETGSLHGEEFRSVRRQ